MMPQPEDYAGTLSLPEYRVRMCSVSCYEFLAGSGLPVALTPLPAALAAAVDERVAALRIRWPELGQAQ